MVIFYSYVSLLELVPRRWKVGKVFRSRCENMSICLEPLWAECTQTADCDTDSCEKMTIWPESQSFTPKGLPKNQRNWLLAVEETGYLRPISSGSVWTRWSYWSLQLERRWLPRSAPCKILRPGPCTKGLQIWTRNPPSWRHPEGPALGTLGIKASWNGLRLIGTSGVDFFASSVKSVKPVLSCVRHRMRCLG